MHQGARRAVGRFYYDNRGYLDDVPVADLGALNINGAVKEIIPHAVGFDIVEGPGVDVVIEPGNIPVEHRGKYGAVTSVSSFAYCPDVLLYKKQIMDLLVPGGLLFLVTCSDKCRQMHTTSDNAYGFQDCIRIDMARLEKFFAIEFEILEIGENNYDHPDYVMVAKLRT